MSVDPEKDEAEVCKQISLQLARHYRGGGNTVYGAKIVREALQEARMIGAGEKYGFQDGPYGVEVVAK